MISKIDGNCCSKYASYVKQAPSVDGDGDGEHVDVDDAAGDCDNASCCFSLTALPLSSPHLDVNCGETFTYSLVLMVNIAYRPTRPPRIKESLDI